MEVPQVPQDQFAIHWPEPPHLKFKDGAATEEPCEIEFRSGSKESGHLLHFTGRDDYFIFKPHRGHTLHNERIVVKLANVKELRLTRLMAIAPAEESSVASNEPMLAPAEIQVYNVELTDGEITSGETAGYVRLPSGLFLYFQAPAHKLLRVMIPEDGVAYFQIGDPIGKLLVDENVVSEEQLKEAVEKQQQLRRLVLGDYLIEQGYIVAAQLEQALLYQKQKPSLRLGEALIEMGALSSEALQAALASQRSNRGRPLGQILVDMGVLDPETLTKVHAKKLGLPFVNLTGFKINPEALGLLPAATARRLMVLPLAVEDGALIVASAGQPDPGTMSELGLLARMRVVPVIASGGEIRAKQDEFYGDAVVHNEQIADPSSIRFAHTPAASLPLDRASISAIFESGKELDLIEEVGSDSERALIQVVNRMLTAALRGGELDVRIETEGTTRRTQIRFRQDRGRH